MAIQMTACILLLSYFNIAEPVKYISSCNIDVDDDGNKDIIIAFENDEGTSVIALVRRKQTTGKNRYDTYILVEKENNIYLTCGYEKSILAIIDIRDSKKRVKVDTNGTVIRVWQPEGAIMAFIWENNGFKKYWVSD